MAWKKGESGNPGGRPAVVKEVQTLARSHMADAITTLHEICMDPKASQAARVAAANGLLDRAAGKPVQSIESGPRENLPTTDLTTDELRQMLQEMQEAEGAPKQ